MAQAVSEPPATAEDQRLAFDRERARCPVARDAGGGWTVYRYRDLSRILADHRTFSNRVSGHLSVPNGMDPPTHAAYRAAIEPYFAPARIEAFEPRCRALARQRLAGLEQGAAIDCMEAFAGPFAAEAQCGFLGWPHDLAGELRTWTRRNQAATRAGDRERLAALAREFAQRVEGLLEARRAAGADSDITARLLYTEVAGRPLATEEIVSILRNWTVGEVGTIAAAVGILAGYLADHPQLQRQLRADPERLPYAIDEILRLDGPLVANRRRATCPVALGGQAIETGEHLSIVWIAANRDPEVFEAPDAFRWDRDPADNLLYGAGSHVCPGAPLARMELRVAMEELLRATSWIEPAEGEQASRATAPAAGFERLPLRLHRG